LITEKEAASLISNTREAKHPVVNRLLNFFVAGLLMMFTGPLLLFVGLVLYWESRGPVFDTHASINRDGHPFEALTFRTTEYDEARARWARKVTRVGKFVLYTRIVSLPQLINVLRGDISLIEMGDYSSSFSA
jgi:lipopolysaccharide/colanic/teichoic acid biosynthesis glycosyltransferase